MATSGLMGTQEQMRRGLTVEYRQEKLQGLKQELQSDEHYDQTETLAYGHVDPFEVPLNTCDLCGGIGQMQRAEGGRTRWVVACKTCGHAPAEPQKRLWQAALEWNMKNLTTAAPYNELPLFGLSRLTPAEATTRLAGIRRNLELRKKIAGLERSLANVQGTRPPGLKYQERLDAYLKWAMYGLRLTKLARKG